MLLMTAGWIFGFGCGQDPNTRNDLAAMRTDHIVIKGTTFEVWLALTPEERQLGLMQTPESALAPIPPGAAMGFPAGAQRGMLFVFSDEELQAFWMQNTIIPLDIAYLRSDGVIIRTYTMAALETRTYPSVEPAQFVLETRAGLLAELKITAGDKAEIPESVLKGVR
jgi:uncharacterized membrane protein (UPF0127 family)